MGRIQAEEMRKWLEFDVALEWHLTSNHYPPVSTTFIPACKEAIEHGNMQDWEYMIKLPNGKEVSVGEIIEGLHLDTFLDTYPESLEDMYD